MDTSEKTKYMTEAAKNLADMIQKRMNNRVEILNTLSNSPMDNLSDEVKAKREDEASKLRAVISEQKDIVEIIKMLFPDA